MKYLIRKLWSLSQVFLTYIKSSFCLLLLCLIQLLILQHRKIGSHGEQSSPIVLRSKVLIWPAGRMWYITLYQESWWTGFLAPKFPSIQSWSLQLCLNTTVTGLEIWLSCKYTCWSFRGLSRTWIQFLASINTCHSSFSESDLFWPPYVPYMPAINTQCTSIHIKMN